MPITKKIVTLWTHDILSRTQILRIPFWCKNYQDFEAWPFQKNSPYIEIFNYYLHRSIQNGLVKRLFVEQVCKHTTL